MLRTSFAWFVAPAFFAFAGSSVLGACGGSDGSIFDDGSKNGSSQGLDGGNANGDANGDPNGAFDPNAGTGEDGGATDTLSEECKKMDIVFVVDNSGSMGEEQDNLSVNFPKFGTIIDGYKTASGKSLDYRLAVATTDAGKDKGAFVRKPTNTNPLPPWWPFQPPSSGTTCEAGPDRAWLERGDGKPVDYFACRARLGTNGSGFEEPLHNLLLGLTDRVADKTNADTSGGFLRDDALLAFVVLTDEDESGNTPAIEDYPPSFDKLKGGERGRWAAAVIAGETACKSKQLGNATEAKKLKQFIGDVGPNGVFSSICEGDLTPGLTKALDTFGKACKAFPSGPK